MSEPMRLTWNEALSGTFGSISLASWIFLLLPQLVENYANGNADGLSLTFLFTWFIGDVTNLAGAVWAGLVPTVIALAVYFCLADFVLISQCLYYNALAKRREGREKLADGVPDGAPAGQSEQTSLLDAASPKVAAHTRRLSDVREDNTRLPGSRRRSSATSRRRTNSDDPQRRDSLSRILEEPSRSSSWTKNTVSVLAIITAGAAGWAIAWKTGAWRPAPVDHEGGHEAGTPVGASILGYASAVCYLGARIPQIVKNQRERSCDGLSLLFFLLSLLGNATYGAGILFHSVERQYFLTNLPWLIGSLGTMAEDALIFIQFSVFGEREPEGESAVDE